jgi:hypothetical protein
MRFYLTVAAIIFHLAAAVTDTFSLDSCCNHVLLTAAVAKVFL